MSEISQYFSGDLPSALNQALDWLLVRLNANVSPFVGNAVYTPTSPSFVEGAMNSAEGGFSGFAQERWPNVVLDPLFNVSLDEQAGPDGFPINYTTAPLLTGCIFVNVLPVVQTAAVSGRVFNLLEPASHYRVDVYSRTDCFYYQGSSPVASDGTWNIPSAHPGAVIAFLMPSTTPQPAQGSSTSLVTGWLAHSNSGVGNKLRDYFVRLMVKTDIEYLQEDNVPVFLQDSTHARFGSSLVVAPGTPVAHVLYNHPQLGPVDLYSTAQNAAVYSDLPRSIEVPPGDPDFASPDQSVHSNLASIQNRCWIYDAALALIAFSVAGFWDAAQRIVTRLNTLRDDPGFLPSLGLEDAEDNSTARWSLQTGAGTVASVFDATEPPRGSQVISFTATSVPAAWAFTGAGFPDSSDTVVQWKYKASGDVKFVVQVTTSTAQVTQIEFVFSGVSGYNPATKTITSVQGLTPDAWRVVTASLSDLIHQYLPNENLSSIAGFEVVLDTTEALNLDNLCVGTPQPAGSLSFSYDVYNGQVDQAYIRSGSIAWVCYAYSIYMERTGDFARAALALQTMLNFLFSLQSTASDARKDLITLGWGRYEDPGYRYIPGQLTGVSTEHNIDCYFAFEKASRVLPTAAQNLLNRGLITPAQYASLNSTASTASAKAGQIRSALLTQLWIPAAGSTKGHFAQGASETGLDTALALDAAGTWAALFCHEVAQDDKGVECLEFIFESFLLTNRQILKSSQPDSFNQAYEQLVAFDGFKAFADSPGGYSGSPDAVWTEGTWSALAAFLRYSENASLCSYFDANYTGGLDAFLARLVQSMKTVASTTGHCGVLAFSLAARSLPWEMGVRKGVSPTAWFWLTATRNDVLFTETLEGLYGRPYLKVPRGVQQSIRQLEGQGSIGALEIETLEGSGLMTALAATGALNGRLVTLKVGYPGMASSDFVTVATQQIESIEALQDSTGYILQCRDLKRTVKTKVFTCGDDGQPTARDHPRSLLANPMDVALIIFQNELGLGQIPHLPESSWKLYDPKAWDAVTNPTLIEPNPCLDVEKFLFYRDGIFSGCLLDFQFDQPVEAKQFLEYEIFRALGGYLIVLPDGRLSPRFFVPPYSFRDLFAFNENNLTVLPGIERQPIINQVTFRMDYDGSGFQRELLFLCAPSLQQYGLAGQHIIESKGLKLARGGASLAALTATRIFRRYAGLDPVSSAPNGGAPTLSVTSHFLTLTVEVGDYVLVSHPLLPNFQTGRRGIYNRLFEVIEKQPDFAQGTMAFRLLDAEWMRSKRISRLAPPETPAWPSATQAQRDRYMFVCADSTRQYTDGTTAKTIW